MPAFIPPVQFNGYESNISAPVANFGTVITANSTIHTKGTYSDLIASTSFDAYWVVIAGANVFQAGTATSLLCDIAIGAAAAETVIIPNLNFGGARDITQNSSAAQGWGQQYAFPLYIPAGSRVSAACQSLISSDTVALTIKLYGRPSQPVWAGSVVTDYGTTLATSLGTTVGTGAGSESAYTQITASTTAATRYIAVGVGFAADTTIQGGGCFIDVGMGAATETLVLTDGFYTTGSNESMSYASPIGAYVDIPSGTRLAARIQRDSTGAESHDVIIYGVN